VRFSDIAATPAAIAAADEQYGGFWMEMFKEQSNKARLGA
jgi:hypothetical protein